MKREEILVFYEKIKVVDPDKYYFDQSSLLNDVGYYLVRQRKFEDAITIFRYNAKMFPTEANLFDSLGEAYFLNGNKEKAIETLNIALKLDPNLESSKAMILQLQK
jgi:tetratricopeptide (TPR) repeat protein